MRKMSSAFQRTQKRLDARKKTISKLVKGIEQHEHERDDALQSRAKFSDPKYRTNRASVSSFRASSRGSTGSDTSMTSSNLAAEKFFDNVFEVTKPENAKEKSKKKSASPRVKGKGTASSTGPKLTKRRTSVGHPGNKSKTPASVKDARNMANGRGDSIKKPGAKESKQPFPSYGRKKTSSESRFSDSDRSDMRGTSPFAKNADVKIKVEDDVDSDEDEEEGFLHIIEALHCFQKTKYIFMQRLLDYNEIEAAGISFHTDSIDLAYQILNVEGQLLFLMQQQKLRCTGFILYSKKSFENILYDIYGNKVLKFIGPSVFMSKMTSKMSVTDGHDRTLGYIKAFGTKINYSIYNAIGERLFLVVSNLYLPTTTTDFTILCRGQKIGTIKYGWKHTLHDLNYIDYETSGIEIPPELDDREKALLLGCLMLIEFFWYSPLTRLKLSMLFVGIILFVIAILILLTPIIIDNPRIDPQTNSYYVAEKLEKPKVNGTIVEH